MCLLKHAHVRLHPHLIYLRKHYNFTRKEHLRRGTKNIGPKSVHKCLNGHQLNIHLHQ